jgi:RsiW-degrading membrane proteinase PrsW (M82 family)
MQPDVFLYIISYAFLTTLAVLWFLVRVRPKFPSGIAAGFVVFLGLILTLGVLTILEFAIAPMGSGHRAAITIGYDLKISLIEETIKLSAVVLALLIARDDARSVNSKLSLAFLSGITFGIIEALFYLSRASYSPVNALLLFLSRMAHPVFTITLVSGLVLIQKRRLIEGGLAVGYTYLSHAFLDYYIPTRSFYKASGVILLELAAFIGVIYLLMPDIKSEKKQREEAIKKATVDLSEHWLNRIENTESE